MPQFNAQDKIKALVSAHVRADMPDEIKSLVRLALADLHFGPAHAYPAIDDAEIEAFPGFESATLKISAWARDNMPSELWVDLDCEEVLTSAPQGEEVDGEWVEPYTAETCQLERADIKRAVFGELAEYV